jgi:hypothetical protein
LFVEQDVGFVLDCGLFSNWYHTVIGNQISGWLHRVTNDAGVMTIMLVSPVTHNSDEAVGPRVLGGELIGLKFIWIFDSATILHSSAIFVEPIQLNHDVLGEPVDRHPHDERLCPPVSWAEQRIRLVLTIHLVHSLTQSARYSGPLRGGSGNIQKAG